MSPSHARLRCVLLIGALCAGVLFCSRAVAEPAAPEADAAYDTALGRALSAHESGDYAAAEQAMRQAHALAPNARTLRGLGVILYAQGRYLEAVEPLEAALLCTERPLDRALRVGVEELLARLFQRLGRLTLRIEPAHSTLRIDGSAPAARSGHEVLLAPGEHNVEVQAEGYESYALTLRTTPGSRDSLHVALARAKSAGSPARSAPELPPRAMAVHTERADGQRRIWRPLARNSVLGAGAALTLAGGTSWLIGYLRYRDLYDSCGDKDGCSDREAGRRYEARRIGPLTTTGVALFATGVALLAVAGGIELWQRHRERKRTGVALTPTGLRVSGQF